jgi:agmatinase
MSDDWMMDRAFAATSPYGMGMENAFAGALSLFRRRYAKDPAGADVAIMGVPFDLAVSNRPGTRFGPRAIRAASAQLSWSGGAWRWDFDPFARMHVVDTGDCAIDYTQPQSNPKAIEDHAAALLAKGVKLLSLGGDHFVTYPLLKAHAARHGPLALIQFDSHSDTWREPEKGINHGYFRDIGDTKPDPDLLDMAATLIERKVGEFDAKEFHNRYVDALKKLIAEKQRKKGEKVIQDPDAGKPAKASNVIDLMAALKKSLGEDAPKKKAAAKPAARRAPAKKAPAKRAAAGGRRR